MLMPLKQFQCFISVLFHYVRRALVDTADATVVLLGVVRPATNVAEVWNALTSLSLYPNGNFHAVPSSANVSLPVSSRFAETRFAEIRVRV